MSISYLGTGAVEPLGNASSCLLSSPTGDRIIAVRCEPQAGTQVIRKIVVGARNKSFRKKM